MARNITMEAVAMLVAQIVHKACNYIKSILFTQHRNIDSERVFIDKATLLSSMLRPRPADTSCNV
jgi:hypothetical protein